MSQVIAVIQASGEVAVHGSKCKDVHNIKSGWLQMFDTESEVYAAAIPPRQLKILACTGDQ